MEKSSTAVWEDDSATLHHHVQTAVHLSGETETGRTSSDVSQPQEQPSASLGETLRSLCRLHALWGWLSWLFTPDLTKTCWKCGWMLFILIRVTKKHFRFSQFCHHSMNDPSLTILGLLIVLNVYLFQKVLPSAAVFTALADYFIFRLQLSIFNLLRWLIFFQCPSFRSFRCILLNVRL